MPGWVAAVVIACLESTSTPQTESAAVDGGVLSPRYSEAARAEVRLSGMQETPETQVRSLGREDPLEEEMTVHSSGTEASCPASQHY